MFEPRILSKDDLRTLWRDVQVSHTGPFGCFYSRDLIATIDDLTAKLEEAKQREMLYRRVVSTAEDIVWCDRATPLNRDERRLSEALSALNKEDERPEMTRDEQRR